MCRVLEISRSGYYKWSLKRNSGIRRGDMFLTVKISEIHEKSKKTYGLRRITAELNKEGIKVNKKRIFRLMRLCGIRAKMKKRFKTTTNSDHKLPKAENLLIRVIEIIKANVVWVGDITYIWTKEGWLYLASVMDLWSRKIIGWCFGVRIDKGLVVGALRMAIETRKIEKGLIFHSDQGSQYASKEFVELLNSNEILQSMSGRGRCYDNAFKESFWHTLKTELIYHETYETRKEAEYSIFEYIEMFYNRHRLHSSLNYMSPVDFENANKLS
jgi:putative transposase